MNTMKILGALVVIAIVSSLTALGYQAWNQNTNSDSPSVGYNTNEVYADATTSSSSIPTTATTTNPILAKDDNRNGAKVCYLSGTSTIFLHPKGQSTTTDVVLNEGIPLYPTSTQSQTCETLIGFRGILFGIAQQAAVVTVTEW